MSPWGVEGPVPIDLYVVKPDLAGQLAAVDAEMRAHGLHLTLSIDGVLPRKAGAFRLLGYAGRDPLGRPLHATRAVTPVGVPLAVGPLDAGDMDRSRATELVPALQSGPDPARPLEGAAYRSGGDLTGDGSPDVVLRNDAGALEVWHLEPLGATRYEVAMVVPPTSGADVDRDGRVDLVGREPAPKDDAIAPDLDDVATFEGGRFTDASAIARAHHERRLAAIEVAQAKLEDPNDDAKARLAVERAWHAL
ncbi:MAG TPA: VCBS repeat-containing protein, partial [Byssovorax sp.]